MKKHDHKDQRDVEPPVALRQAKLLSLIFGGVAAKTALLGTSLPMPISLDIPKEPRGAGE